VLGPNSADRAAKGGARRVKSADRVGKSDVRAVRSAGCASDSGAPGLTAADRAGKSGVGEGGGEGGGGSRTPIAGARPVLGRSRPCCSISSGTRNSSVPSEDIARPSGGDCHVGTAPRCPLMN
jgi:hypothetical protein